MPNWNDPNSIKAWLAKNKDNGAAENKAKVADRQANEQRAADRAAEGRGADRSSSILKPLVSGSNGRDVYNDSPTGRKRAEPQQKQRVREQPQQGPMMPGDDRTRIGDIPWKGGSIRDELNVPVQRSSMLPGLPSLGGTPLDWVGMGDSPAAKYADWQSQQDRTDKNPELFPGYDNVLDFSYQFFDAPGRAATTTPFIPATPGDKRALGIPANEDARFSIAEAGSYAGQILNQTFNPFNPNKDLGNGAANQAKAVNQLRQNYQYRSDINQLPADQRDAAWRVWTSNAQSNNAPQVFDEIANRPQKVSEAQQKMAQAQTTGDEVSAARWGQEVERLNNLDERQIIESNQNPWAEIVFGVAVDPVDWVTGGATELLGMTPKLAKAAKAVKAFNLDPEVAIKSINDVVTNSAPVVEKILKGQDIRGFWEGAMNPIARTAEAKAYLDTRNLTETAMMLATGIRDKAAMQSAMTDWLTTGGQNLIRDFGVGAGVLGNAETVKRYPILKAAEQAITGMKTLQGDGALDVGKFIPEFAKVIEDTARTAYGVKDEMNPALKALSFPSRFMRAVLVDGYLNLAPRNWIRQAASQTANALGDDSYSLRPLANIVADVTKKAGGMASDMRFQSDEVFSEAAAATQAKHWTQYFGLGKDNPVAKLSAATGKVWQGSTTALGGTIPIGEQAFYDKIYGTTYLRSFDNFWKDAVSQQFVPAIEALGLEPEFGKTLAGIAIEAGKTGSKDDVANAVRTAITQATIKDVTALKIPDELLPLELRGAINDVIQTHGPEAAGEAWTKVSDILTQARQYAEKAIEGGPPTWRPEFTKEGQLDDLAMMAQNLTQLARKGGLGSKEAGASAMDLARNILKMEDDGYKAFMGDLAQAADPKAMDYALDIWQRVYDLKNQARQSVDAVNAEAIKAANAAGNDKAARSLAWQGAYQKTAETWQNYVGQFQGTIDEARQTLLGATSGQPFPTGKGWNDVLERYWKYDQSVIEQARQLDPGGSFDGALATVRDANRAMVDHASTELFDVLRRFPTTDSLDIINSVMRQADSMGSQVAGMVRRAAEEAKGSNDWEKFYAYRNHMWGELAQDSVEAFAAAKRGVVWNWLADQVPTKLRWSDDFAGDFQLVGPLDGQPGTWIVKDGNGQLAQLLEQGSQDAAKAPGAAADMLNGPKNPRIVSGTQAARAPSGGAGVYVPRSVIDDYNTLVKGNLEDVVDDILDDIAPFADPDELAKRMAQNPQQAADAMNAAGMTVDAPKANDFPGWEMDFGDGLTQAADEVAQAAAPVVDNVAQATTQAAPTVQNAAQRPAWAQPIQVQSDVKEINKAITRAGPGVNNPVEYRLLDGSIVKSNPMKPQVSEQFGDIMLDDGNLASIDTVDEIMVGGQSIWKRTPTPTAAPASQAQNVTQVAQNVTEAAAPVVQDVAQAVTPGTTTTITDVRKAAAGVGIGTDKTDAWLWNSVKKNWEDMGLAEQPKNLKAMAPEDLTKAQDYYTKRADLVHRSQWDSPVTAADAARDKLSMIADSKSEIADLIRNASDQGAVTSASIKKMGGAKVANWLNFARKQQDLGDATWMREFDESLQKISPNTTLADLLSLYDDLLSQEPALKATIKDSEQFITRGVNKAGSAVFPHRIDEIMKAVGEDTVNAIKAAYNLTDEDMTKIDRRSFLRYYEDYLQKSGPELGDEYAHRSNYFAGGLGAVRAWPDWMVPKPLRKGMWKPTGNAFTFTPDGDAYESIKQGIRQARMAKKARPEMGDVALAQMKGIDQLESYLQQNLPSILAGAPNTLTPQMQIQVMDLVTKKLLPNWDNVHAAASSHGRKMGEWAMMDFNDRRNFDTALALVLPFHYYFTRSAGNWLQRIAAKPALLDLYLETQGAIAGENQRTQVVDGQTIPMPDRLQGTVPNPLKQVVDAPWMPDRLQNPLNWTLPFAMYAPSNFTEDVEGDDQQQALNSTLQYLAEKTFPWYQAPMYAWMDQNIPVKEGEKPRLQQFMESQQVGDYFPLARTAAYGLQAAGVTGAPGPAEINGNKVPFLNLGTELDPYFQGRVTRNETAMGNMTEERAQYANQYLLNQQQGGDPFNLIPPDEQATAKADAAKMGQQTGVERFGREFGGWLSGMTNQYYPEGEQQYQAANQSYRNAGFGPENLGGSKAARTDILENNPELPVGWGISSLLPGAEINRPPGASQMISATYDTAKDLQSSMKAQADAAVDAAIAANPKITNKEMNAIRDGVEAKFQPGISSAYDKAKAMGEKYPIPSGDGASRFTYAQGMNPAENKLAQADQVFKNSFALQRPADGASKAEKDAFYRERDQSTIDGLIALGYSKDEAAKMWQDRLNKNYTPDEIAQREKNRIAWESYDKSNSVDWQNRRAGVTAAYGEDAAGVWDAYLDLPKGSAARQAYKDAHPELDAYNLAAFQPEGYSYLSQRYGKDAVLDWAHIPKWTEDKAVQEQRTAYLDAKPGAWMVDAWVDGRPKPFDPTSNSTTRNYGTDWGEAETRFGLDIWDKVHQYRTATGKDRYAVRDSLELKPFLDWWYGQMPKTEYASTLRPASAYRGGGGRAFGGGGGGGGGWNGGGGGGGGNYVQRPFIQQVDPRYMDRNLEVQAQSRPWRQIERVGEMPDWLFAGQNLKPARTSWR